MRVGFYLKSLFVAASLLAVFAREVPARIEHLASNRAAANDVDAGAIKRVLSTYETALNTSDTTAVMPLYMEDGVFMPPYSQSAVGAAEVRKAYDAVFKAISFNVKFNVVELVQMAPDWAFARTNSAGTTTSHATGATHAEGNQELFIFKKSSDGKWKIARYSFSSTNPLPN